MDYIKLAEIYKKLESTTKRLEKADIIADFIKKVSANELRYIIYLLEGVVFPPWDERKLGLSSQLSIKIIATSTGIGNEKVVKKWKQLGDLGLVAEELVKEKKQKTLHQERLTVEKVFNNLQKIAGLEGEGTVSKKVNLVSELLSSASPLEARYIIRTCISDLRIGVAEGILRDAIAKAFNVDPVKVEKAADLLSDYAEVIKLVKEGSLEEIKLSPGRPIKAMLSIRVESIKEGFEAVGKPAIFEIKLDGFRVMIYNDGKEIKLFTRRLENVTKQFKELIPVLNKHIKAKNYIIDTEVVGHDSKTGMYLPFQMISQRIKRKYDIEKTAREFPVEVNVFDIIYYNNKSLINEPLIERRKILEKIISEAPKKIVLTKKLVTDDEGKAKKFYKDAVEKGLEGVMIKNINSIYQPGRRVSGWVKFKPTLEPLDLTIVGAEYGTGKRAHTLSSFLLACKHKDKFLECGMMGTGIKEKGEGVTFTELTKLLKPHFIEEKGRHVKIKPHIVIEVGYEEIQKSPKYSSGYALRFPKFSQIRVEKPLSEISSLEELERVFKSQRGRLKHKISIF